MKKENENKPTTNDEPRDKENTDPTASATGAGRGGDDETETMMSKEMEQQDQRERFVALVIEKQHSTWTTLMNEGLELPDLRRIQERLVGQLQNEWRKGPDAQWRVLAMSEEQHGSVVIKAAYDLGVTEKLGIAVWFPDDESADKEPPTAG